MSHPVGRSPFRMGRDPFGDLRAVSDELSRLFGSALLGGRGGFPEVDLEEDDDGWTVIARLPGVAPEEVIVEVDDRELSIRARREGGVGGEEAAATERHGGFDYRLSIPGDVNADGVDATMDHGLLTVRLPRAERSKRRTVAVGRATIGGSTAERSTTEDADSGGTPAA
jgi:HSP20 family protein